MEHSHHHHRERNLGITVFLNLIITVAEVVGGLLSGSLALLSDALHNFGDTIAVLSSFIALKIGKRTPDERMTYGYKRAEILAALFNTLFLFASLLIIFREAVLRLINPIEIKSTLMLIVAVIGLLANLFSVLLLKRHSKESINIRSAYLHLIADTLSSVLVVLGAIIIMFTGIRIIDPIFTFLIGILVLKEGISILRESVAILMQSAPPGVDMDKLKERVEEVEGVKNIHHLHMWRSNDREIYLEAHVDLEEDMSISEADSIRKKIEEIISGFGINHTTIQMEYDVCEDKDLIRRKSP